MIAVSVVSHGHGRLIEALARRLLSCAEVAEIIVTRNIPEALSLPRDGRIRVIDNDRPKGFASNHNQAFRLCSQPFFCPLNPDVSWDTDPFGDLVSALLQADGVLVAPLVKAPDGRQEDNIRYFPTPASLLRKALGGDEGRYPLARGSDVLPVEWVAGMLMLFRSEDFSRLGGFDEGFFLYYEDVDICVRAWKSGMKVLACPRVSVIHDARRDSRKSLRYMGWHLASMARYFCKHGGRLPALADEARGRR